MNPFLKQVDPIYIIRREGTKENPYAYLQETLQVSSSKVILTEIPEQFSKVIVKDLNGNRIAETLSQFPNVNQFYADYRNGIIYFNEADDGRKFSFEYKGIGVISLPASRMYIQEEISTLPISDKISDMDDNINSQKSRLDAQLTSITQPSEIVDLRVDSEGLTHTVARDRLISDENKINKRVTDLTTDTNTRFNSTFQRLDLNDEDIATNTQQIGTNTQQITATGERIDDLTLDTNGKFDTVNAQLAETSAEITDLQTAKADKTEINTLASGKADKTYVDTLAASLASGSPKGTFATLAALQTAFPTGNTNIYLVTADGKWYYWSGSAWTAGGVYQSTGIALGSVTYDKTDFMKLGKNYFNKVDVTADTFMSTSTGNTYALAGYYTSGFIFLKGGKSYTFNKVRLYCLFDASQVFSSGVNTNNNDATVTINQVTDGYVRVAISSANLNIFQIEEGTAVTTYEPYGLKLSTLLVKDTDILPTGMNKKLTIQKSGNALTLSCSFGGSKTLKTTLNLKGSNNGSFVLGDVYLDSTLVHGCADDITPIRTFTTVGANHGYTCVSKVTLAGHGKTTADLGSQWTDGTDIYTLLLINGNDLTFGNDYTVTNGVVSGKTTLPRTTLTHVSGATNTGNITVGTVVSDQLRPGTTNKIKADCYVDGTLITADGTYYGDNFEIRENYNIVSYKALIDYARSNIGVSFKNDNVTGAVSIAITYRYTDGLNCLISHTFKVLEKLTIMDCGFIQSQNLVEAAGTLKRYMPNVKLKSGYDFKSIVTMTNYATSIDFMQADLIDVTKPSNRYVDWLEVSGSKLIGFTAGYIPDKTDASNAKRLASTSKIWDMRSTKKSYPVAMSGLTFNIGDYKTFQFYRNYLDPSKVGELTNINIVKDNQNTYVYIDSHVSVTGKNIKLDGLVGKSITVLDSENFTLLNDVVDADGVTFSIASSYGYAVLKV